MTKTYTPFPWNVSSGGGRPARSPPELPEPPELARNPLELARGVPEPARFYSKRRRRRLLRMTKTDEKAMAAPAIIGSSRPRAAIGIAAVL